MASDSKAVRLAAVQKYGASKIVTSANQTLEHTAKEHCTGQGCAVSSHGFHLAVAEWWLMAFADYFVITQ